MTGACNLATIAVAAQGGSETTYRCIKRGLSGNGSQFITLHSSEVMVVLTDGFAVEQPTAAVYVHG